MVQDQKDVFAEIAARRQGQARAELVEPAPPKAPKKLLKAGLDAKAVFTPKSKVDSPAKLSKALEAQRRRTARYMQDLAPEMPQTRRVIPLATFDYRLETDDDRANASLAFDGGGPWERVGIPHYGGPARPAVAYYRTTFDVTADDLNRSVWVKFKGVDYVAHVFVNGHLLGSHEGFFAPFEFDATAVAHAGENVLLVRVENDAPCKGHSDSGVRYEGDKIYAATGMGWDDPQVGWHHCPPGMGIYQDAFVEVRARIHVHDLFVRPLLPDSAEAWVELTSTSLTKTQAKVELSVFGQNFRTGELVSQRHEVKLGHRRNDYQFRLSLRRPKLWDMETPWLYQLQVRVLSDDGVLLDGAHRQFGMRQFELDTTTSPRGMFRLNGRRIRLRGANTMGHEQQCVARKDWDQLRDDILLAKICHMNFWRLTQRPVQREVYDYCDRLGLMTQTDLPLFGVLHRSQFCEAVRQSNEMERLIRSHACNIAISYINEPFPLSWHNAPHRQLLREELEAFFRAADEAVLLANPDRVIKHVDGDYDPPDVGLPDNHCYNTWYNGHGLPIGRLIKGYWLRVKPGWNYACGEFGTEGLDNVDVMLARYPKHWLPERIEDDWSPGRIVAAQTERFHHMWFPTQRTLPEWVRHSQAFQAWGLRTMIEAMRRDPRMISIAMFYLIDTFPAGWMKAVMCADRQPKQAFYACRETLAPLAANIRTDRRTYFGGQRTDCELWVCNDHDHVLRGHRVHWQVKSGRTVLAAGAVRADVPALMPACVGRVAVPLPKVTSRTTMRLEMAVRDRRGRMVHDTACEFEVFPPPRTVQGDVALLGQRGGPAWLLAQELGLTVRPWRRDRADIILCDSILLARRDADELASSVRAGSRLVLTDLALRDTQANVDIRLGEKTQLDLAGQTLVLEEPGMGGRYFVNCSTEHPMVRGFEPYDFFLWHDEATDCIEPMLRLVMRADGLEPILISGQGDWATSQWHRVPAAGRVRVGDGELLVSLVQLSGRTRTNPVAREYALRLLGL